MNVISLFCNDIMMCFNFVLKDKGRYEFVTGMNMKNLEDVIEFWVDLVKSYPAIVALIDPVRKKVV